MLTRRRFLKSGSVAGAAALALPMLNRQACAAADAGQYSLRAIDLVQQSTVIDMLGLVTMNDAEWERWAHGAGMNAEEYRRFSSSGIQVMHHAFGLGGPDAFAQALQYFADLNGFVARYSEQFARIASVADIERLRSTGKFGVLMGLQGSDHFRTADDVRLFHGLGQRVSQLTYNSQNLIGCGSTERKDCGVTDFGVSIIKQMNEVGMLVDVSHCGDLTTLDAFELSNKPVAITHSNCRALNKHPRLKTDEAIRKMAATGGVMGISGVRMFIRDKEPTTIEHMVDHIDHVVKLVGIEHVGIGSDADLIGYDAQPREWLEKLRASYKSSYAFRERIDIAGFDHPRKIFDLTEALIRRGYSDANIRLILGGNFKRMLAEVWA